MLGLIQKILLTVVSIAIALLMAFGFYVVIFEENNKFEYEMLILVALAIFGALSFVFHIKTLKFYKTKSLLYLNFKKDKPFWVFNIAFILSLLLLSLFFAYQYYKIIENGPSFKSDFWPFLIVIFLPLIISAWLFFDARYLYQNYKNLEAKATFNTIDDIKGVEGETEN